MSNEDVGDFLEHFGVKGMRWGIINKSNSSSDSKKSSSKNKKNGDKDSLKTVLLNNRGLVLAGGIFALHLANVTNKKIRSLQQVSRYEKLHKSSPNIATLAKYYGSYIPKQP